MYTQHFNVLTENEYNICKQIIDTSKWRYGHTSDMSNVNGGRFWKIDELEKNEFFNSMFMDKIEKSTNKIFKIHRIYANGHTFGQEGGWHTDSRNEDDWTFLYYFNQGDPSEIGETYFKDDNGNIIDIAKPIYNSGILFKSNITHRGSGPKITFNDLRVSIAFKLKLIPKKLEKTLF